jgi:hypothetical protein
MDDAGIDVAVVSLGTPAVHTGIALKRGLWRAAATNFRLNWFVHDRTVSRFACLPLPDVDGSR